MKPEQALYQLLRPHLPGFPERIENVAGSGTPDFHCIYEGRTYWVECKTPKVKKWDLIRLLEPSQIAWYKRHHIYGGKVFFIVRDSNGIHLFNSISSKIGVYGIPFDWSAFSGKIISELSCPTLA